MSMHVIGQNAFVRGSGMPRVLRALGPFGGVRPGGQRGRLPGPWAHRPPQRGCALCAHSMHFSTLGALKRFLTLQRTQSGRKSFSLSFFSYIFLAISFLNLCLRSEIEPLLLLCRTSSPQTHVPLSTLILSHDLLFCNINTIYFPISIFVLSVYHLSSFLSPFISNRWIHPSPAGPRSSPSSHQGWRKPWWIAAPFLIWPEPRRRVPP